MRFKKLIAALGLSAIAASGIGVAFASRGLEKAVETKAATDDTWMFSVIAKFDVPMGWDTPGTDFQFECWGNNVNNEVFDLHDSGRDGYVTANLSFTDDQTITGGRFLFQQGSDSKISTNVTFQCEKDDNGCVMFWRYNDTSWVEEDGIWKFPMTGQTWIPQVYIKYGSTQYDFVADPVGQRYAIRDLVVTEESIADGDYLNNFRFGHDWDYLYYLVRDAVKTEYFKGGGLNWLPFKKAGTYDIFIENTFEDGGVIRVLEHVAKSVSYIYYLSDSTSETTNNVYTFGADEQFGGWPGKNIAGTTGAGTNVTGVVNFNNSSNLVYKIPVTIGYPDGDTGLIFNWQGSAQSNNLKLYPGAAYYWTDETNSYNLAAGQALDLIFDVEDLRNAVTTHGDVRNYSICGIDPTQAKALADRYAALSSEAKAYVDASSTYTYVNNESAAETNVAFTAIFAELAAIGANAGGRQFFDASKTKQTAMTAIVIIAAVGVVSLGALFVLRKKRKA